MRGRSMSAEQRYRIQFSRRQVECGHPSRRNAVANNAAEFIDGTRTQPAAVCQVRTAFGSMSVAMAYRTVLLKKLARILRDGSQGKGQENKEPHGSL